MRSDFRFSMKRVVIAMTLTALGFAIVPLALRTDVNALPSHWVNPYRLAMLLWFFTMPMAAVGCLTRHTPLCASMGIVGALVAFAFVVSR